MCLGGQEVSTVACCLYVAQTYAPSGLELAQGLDAIVSPGEIEGDLRQSICKSRKPDLRTSKEKDDVCKPAGVDPVDPTGRSRVEGFDSLRAF